MDFLLPKKDGHRTSTKVSTTAGDPCDNTRRGHIPRRTTGKSSFPLQTSLKPPALDKSPLYIETKNDFHSKLNFALSTLSSYPPPSSCSIFVSENASYPPPTGG